MIATYYAIYKFNETSQKKGEIVLEGIVRDPKDTICPGQEAPGYGLPNEYELHKFKVEGYKIEISTFNITRKQVVESILY